jgi:hypothetical protein
MLRLAEDAIKISAWASDDLVAEVIERLKDDEFRLWWKLRVLRRIGPYTGIDEIQRGTAVFVELLTKTLSAD